MPELSRKTHPSRSVAGVGLIVYLIALVVTAPAALLDQKINTASAGTVRLVNASGTVWSGHGDLEIRQNGKALGQAHPVSWKLEPTELARAILGFSIFLEGGTRPIPLRIGFSSVELRDLSLKLPAGGLVLLSDQLVPLEPRGEVALQIDHVTFGPQQPEAAIQLEWRNAGSAMTDVAPLGDYRIQCEMRDGRVSITMDTLHGPLILSGRGSWPQGSRPEFKGTARLPAELQTRMASMLRLIAAERGPGEFEIRIK